MNDDNFMILAAGLLGVLQMCGFFGYDMMSFLVEPACHSVRERCPECIIQYAGYYGTAFTNLSYTFGNLLAPCFLPILETKGSLILASFFFIFFSANFFYLRTWLFFPACMFCGFGFALFFSGGGSYALRHSTDRTISRNQSIQCMISSITTVMSGVFLIFSSKFLDGEKGRNMTEISLAQTNSNYRYYSDTEIKILSTGMTIFAIVSLILAVLMPKRNLSNSLLKKTKNISLKQQIGKVFSAIVQKNLLKLSPLFACTGAILALLFTIYPTTFAFTDSLVEDKNMVAYYCIATCVGEFIAGLIFTSIGKNKSIGILMGVLYGFLDGSATNARMVAAAKALPEEPAIAFSVAKFYQAASAMIFLFLSSKLNIHQLHYLSTILVLISIICYISYLRDLRSSKVFTRELPKENIEKKDFEQ
ncbi:unnamed protein product, partial [Mesorhabditis belari]|uniref:UNC93-like protein MFSD11 n=1 Tax=Mesorhabditis belari TaxID=2138241 RepID=A0AAF3EUS0_9BILA